MNLRVRTKVELPATVFAESALANDIDVDSFIASLNNFSDMAHELGESTDEEIMQWREEAVEHYFRLMQEAGKLKHIEQTMFSGSDCGDDEDDPSESNK